MKTWSTVSLLIRSRTPKAELAEANSATERRGTCSYARVQNLALPGCATSVIRSPILNALVADDAPPGHFCCLYDRRYGLNSLRYCRRCLQDYAYQSHLQLAGTPFARLMVRRSRNYCHRGRATGIVALGGIAMGVFAFGGVARRHAISGVSVGLFTMGGLASGRALGLRSANPR
jgi:hypothetical protein